jgi:murein L,D-transpeptidase YcbB/YkuD
MYRFIFLILSAVVFFSCTDKRKPLIAQVPRDSTIVPAVAYTNLKLDSTAVAQFLLTQATEEDFIPRIRNFYNNRNYQYAWFDEQGLTEQGEAFWNLHQLQEDEDKDSSLSARRLHDNMQILLNEDTSNFTRQDLQNIELDLTLHFFRYVNTAFTTMVQPEQMQWYIPMRKINEETMLDSFLTDKGKDWKPLNQSFYRLQNKMREFATIAKSGGWQQIEIKTARLKEGSTDSVITRVKNRLIISGDYDSPDTSNIFTPQLETAVKKMQRSYGLKESGVIDAALIKMLNVPVEDRLKQMKINLERMRWMPAVGDGIFVNIPEYRLHVFEGKSEVLNMNIVVGKSATRTVIFSDSLEYIVFSPYWNVPTSIVRKEILPAINRSSNYLTRNNMEITGYSNGLPVIRQKPGGANALGKVKFIFPNRYNIYLHDTPARTLFSDQKRAFSHGCIRVERPFDMAKYLLRKDDQWTDDKIKSAMNAGTEKWVKLNKQVPVFIVYFTSWIGADGLLHFAEDIYGHDKRMADHLFQAS